MLFCLRQHKRHYGILRNRLLSPIVFNIDELFALYFSMLTLRSYETTPFHLSVEKLKVKFENCLSTEKIKMLRRVEKVFSLASIQHHNHCYFLSDVLQYTIDEKVCNITYLKKDIRKRYHVQFLISHQITGSGMQEASTLKRKVPKSFAVIKL